MAETIRTIESAPTLYPDPAIPDWVWERIESWCNTRWTPREVVWLVQDCGDWTPPLAPATITKVESWSGDWAEVHPDTTAFGAIPLAGDSHRVTALVGADNPAPAAVIEAAKRLAVFAEQIAEQAGITTYSTSIGPINETWRRSQNAMAQAIQQSGAADLLRPYRKAR